MSAVQPNNKNLISYFFHIVQHQKLRIFFAHITFIWNKVFAKNGRGEKVGNQNYVYFFRDLCVKCTLYRQIKNVPILYLEVVQFCSDDFIWSYNIIRIVSTGAEEQILSRGAQIIRKMSFCEFSKILLSKCSILGGAWAPPAPPVPPPLKINLSISIF